LAGLLVSGLLVGGALLFVLVLVLVLVVLAVLFVLRLAALVRLVLGALLHAVLDASSCHRSDLPCDRMPYLWPSGQALTYFSVGRGASPTARRPAPAEL